ncbi:MAG TPA: L-threonylcarbamoyladenylate synthase, partial [Dehalococcoidia bacterium]
SVATDAAAVERVFEAKGRPQEKAMPVLIGEVAQLADLAAEVPPELRRLMRAFWPGALTVVLPRSPRFVSPAAPGDTVAVRLPDHDWLREVLRLAGPVVGTSANRSGQPSPRRASEVAEQIGHGVDLIVDGGTAPGTASSVVALTEFGVRMLREGAVSRSDLERVVNSPLH